MKAQQNLQYSIEYQYLHNLDYLKLKLKHSLLNNKHITSIMWPNWKYGSIISATLARRRS